MVVKDASDRGFTNREAKMFNDTSDLAITPTWVIPSNTEDQISQLFGSSSSPASTISAAIVFLADEFSVPGQHCVRAKKNADLIEQMPTDIIALSCQPSSL